MVSDLQKDMRFGNLLTQLGLLSETDLSDAAQLAVELALPLGKVLVMSGFMTDAQLSAIVQAQSMLKDQLIDIEEVRKATAIVQQQGVSWTEALRQAGWVQRDVLPANKLGELLVDSEIITQEELDESLRRANQSGLPLGRILALTKRINDALLCSCLNAQILLRDNKISRDQAVLGLKAAHTRQISIEDVLSDRGDYKDVPKTKIKLGEMFVLAGILNEEIIMEAIETGLIKNEPVGQVLVNKDYATMSLLDAALKLQEMVDNGKLNPLNAAEVLRQVHARNIPLSQAVTELGLQRTAGESTFGLADLLKQAGLITEDEIRQAFSASMQNSSLLGKILTITGFLDEDTLSAAVRAQTLVKQGHLEVAQAMIALNYVSRMGGSLDEALIDLGWNIKLSSEKAQQSNR
jgi:hypothetical protein